MRRSLRLLLDGEADMQVVAEAGDLATVVARVQQHRPQVLVLDLGMYNGSSVEAIGRLRRDVPGSEIVVLTMEESPAFERRAIDAGAIGFVVKDRAGGELPDAVRRAARGEAHVSAAVSVAPCSLRQGALVGT
jgi:DNA-binding NarL/FixJ family response regulator